MSKTPSNDEQPVDQIDRVPPGELLRRARRERGVAAEEVIPQLGVTPQIFNALEGSDFNQLPSPLYVKGYIRRYCSVLGISANEVLDSLELYLKEQPERQCQPSIRLVSEPQQKLRIYKLMLPVVAVLLVGALVWLVGVSQVVKLDFFDNEKPQSKTTVAQRNLTLTPALPVDDSQIEGESTGVGRTTASEVDSKATPDDVEPIQLLQIDVLQQSWVEVQDAKGDLLVADLKSSGSVVDVFGVAPFNVELGYAPGIKLNYAGKDWEVSPIASDNTATLKIGD